MVKLETESLSSKLRSHYHRCANCVWVEETVKGSAHTHQWWYKWALLIYSLVLLLLSEVRLLLLLGRNYSEVWDELLLKNLTGLTKVEYHTTFHEDHFSSLGISHEETGRHNHV